MFRAILLLLAVSMLSVGCGNGQKTTPPQIENANEAAIETETETETETEAEAEAEGEIIAEPESRSFKIKVKTDNEGLSQDNEYTIFTSTLDTGYIYNYSVDCDDDGEIEAVNQSSDYTCEYEVLGEYVISISGAFPHFTNGNYSNARKLLDVMQWGTNQWKSLANAFWSTYVSTFSAVDTEVV